MNMWLRTLWPHPERTSATEREANRQEGLDLDARIKHLQSLSKVEPLVYLEAARRIADEEDRRKSGAETRATTFIAAVATLIPLMTWALGNTASTICSAGWGCVTWTAVFILAVVYFVTAAHWALQSLAVANYHVIGVEDIVLIRENCKNTLKELIQMTLLQARKNQDTINQKLTYIKVAQRHFFNGIAVLGLLLMFDPISRFDILTFLRSQVDLWIISPATAPTQSQPPLQPVSTKSVQNPILQLPSASQPSTNASAPKNH